MKQRLKIRAHAQLLCVVYVFCRYWFKGIDLDGDGVIRPYEMEYFYKEQIHREFESCE